jgi:hypothetical protein
MNTETLTHTEFARRWVIFLLALLAPTTLLLVTETVETPAFVAALLLALTLLNTHSLGIRVEAEHLEVRLGSGLLRRRRRITRLTSVETATPAGRIALGRSGRYGLGADTALVLNFEDGERLEVALEQASMVEALLRRRLADIDTATEPS